MTIRRSVLFVSSLTVSAAFAGAGTAQSDAWPMSQGNASHTGYLPVAIDPTSITLHWQVDLGQYGLSPAVSGDGYVFVSESGWSGEKLYSLDKESGAVVWEQSFNNPFSVNPPSYADGRVYLQTCNHASDTWVWGFDADDGTAVIKTPTSAQWESYLAPTIYDGSVYVNGGYYGGMYGVNGTTGSQMWWLGLAQYDSWTPAVDADSCYAYVGGTLSVVDRLTGIPTYTIVDPDFTWNGWSMNQAPILGGMNDVIATNSSSFTGRLVVFDLATQAVRYTIDESITGQPAVHDGAIYVLNSGSLDVRDQLDGSLLWKWIPVTDQLQGNVVVTATHVIVHSSTSTYLIDLTTHQDVWSWPASGQVSLGESNLFIAQSDGTLTALAYEISPQPFTISTTGAKFYEPMPTVTLTGTGFAQGGNTQVLFGAALATDVTVVDDQTLTCTPPVGPAGKVVVSVQNDVGSGVLQQPFSYLPAASYTGLAAPGGTLDISIDMEPQETLIVLIGPGVQTGVTTWPWFGTFELVKPQILLAAPFWPFATFTMSLPLPNNPNLVGLAFSVQALVGDMTTGIGAWTNTETIKIE